MVGKLLRLLAAPFRSCPHGVWHRWDLFQIRGRYRCPGCGMILSNGVRYASIRDFFKGVPK